MIVFPNCKINLGLRILRKRTDGYHDIETVLYPIKLSDALEVIPLKKDGNPANPLFEFSDSGISTSLPPEDNICIKAYQLLKKDFPVLPSIKIHLHKSVPIGAGLGGGSADGAFTLMLLNKKFNLNLSIEQLKTYALQLGSDCPFFIINKPCYATGRGELLKEVFIDLNNYKIVLINPDIPVSTAWAYSRVAISQVEKPLTDILKQPVQSWKTDLINDFEAPVFKEFPETGKIKECLYQSGAIYAALSGSGSSVFGIFHKKTPTNFKFPSSYFIKELSCELK